MTASLDSNLSFDPFADLAKTTTADQALKTSRSGAALNKHAKHNGSSNRRKARSAATEVAKQKRASLVKDALDVAAWDTTAEGDASNTMDFGDNFFSSGGNNNISNNRKTTKKPLPGNIFSREDSDRTMETEALTIDSSRNSSSKGTEAASCAPASASSGAAAKSSFPAWKLREQFKQQQSPRRAPIPSKTMPKITMQIRKPAGATARSNAKGGGGMSLTGQLAALNASNHGPKKIRSDSSVVSQRSATNASQVVSERRANPITIRMDKKGNTSTVPTMFQYALETMTPSPKKKKKSMKSSKSTKTSEKKEKSSTKSSDKKEKSSTKKEKSSTKSSREPKTKKKTKKTKKKKAVAEEADNLEGSCAIKNSEDPVSREEDKTELDKGSGRRKDRSEEAKELSTSSHSKHPYRRTRATRTHSNEGQDNNRTLNTSGHSTRSTVRTLRSKLSTSSGDALSSSIHSQRRTTARSNRDETDPLASGSTHSRRTPRRNHSSSRRERNTDELGSSSHSRHYARRARSRSNGPLSRKKSRDDAETEDSKGKQGTKEDSKNVGSEEKDTTEIAVAVPKIEDNANTETPSTKQEPSSSTKQEPSSAESSATEKVRPSRRERVASRRNESRSRSTGRLPSRRSSDEAADNGDSTGVSKSPGTQRRRVLRRTPSARRLARSGSEQTAEPKIVSEPKETPASTPQDLPTRGLGAKSNSRRRFQRTPSRRQLDHSDQDEQPVAVNTTAASPKPKRLSAWELREKAKKEQSPTPMTPSKPPMTPSKLSGRSSVSAMRSRFNPSSNSDAGAALPPAFQSLISPNSVLRTPRRTVDSRRISNRESMQRAKASGVRRGSVLDSLDSFGVPDDQAATEFGSPQVVQTNGSKGKTRIVVELGEVPPAFRHLIKSS